MEIMNIEQIREQKKLCKEKIIQLLENDLGVCAIPIEEYSKMEDIDKEECNKMFNFSLDMSLFNIYCDMYKKMTEMEIILMS